MPNATKQPINTQLTLCKATSHFLECSSFKNTITRAAKAERSEVSNLKRLPNNMVTVMPAQINIKPGMGIK